MRVKKDPFAAIALACLALAAVHTGTGKPRKETARPTGPAVMWTEPKDLESRDLFYGPGGQAHVPHAPYTFVKEDLDGTSPKFDVKDKDGVKWRVKMGIEAQPETAASRIVWAVGYYVDEEYFLADMQVEGMPPRLKRGWKLVEADGTVHNVRLKREQGDKKAGNWHWRYDAFTNTRELNGLRALMAVINNWDLKDVNNAIREEHGHRIYMISDLGASFASYNRSWPRERAKGDLKKYEESKFIRRLTDETVDFQTPGRPTFEYAVNPKEYLARVHIEWIGRNVPRSDARWMGNLLARLRTSQIHDAFRAAGYSPHEIEGFSAALERRIAELTDL